MSRTPKILCFFETVGQEFTIQRTGGGGPYTLRTITIPDQEWVLADDGSAEDLIDWIKDEIQGYAEFTSTFDMGIDAAGRVYFEMLPTTTATLTWTAAGTDTRDMMRFSGSTLSLSSTRQNGTHAHFGGVYMTSAMQVDLPGRVTRKSVSVSTSGVRETMTAVQLDTRSIRLRYTGEPRNDLDWTEYRMMEEFLDQATTGWHFRLYPDINESTAAYDPDTDRWGYEVWDVESPSDWQHQEEEDAYYVDWLVSLELVEYVD